MARTETAGALARVEAGLRRIERELRRIHPEIITPQDATEMRRQFIETADVAADLVGIARRLMDE